VIQGRETPRIFTPPRRELTPETTHGYACIAFAEEVLEIKLFPWQKWLLLHGLELDETGLYKNRTNVVVVGRQNGKSLLMVVLALWHIYALDSRKVIATAQDLSRAEESWEDAVEWAMTND
jgi:phage terminase large subunit-like protein